MTPQTPETTFERRKRLEDLAFEILLSKLQISHVHLLINDNDFRERFISAVQNLVYKLTEITED